MSPASRNLGFFGYYCFHFSPWGEVILQISGFPPQAGLFFPPLREIWKSLGNIFSPGFLDFRRRRGCFFPRFAKSGNHWEIFFLLDFWISAAGGAVFSPASRNLEIIGKYFFSWISGFPPQAGYIFPRFAKSGNHWEIFFLLDFWISAAGGVVFSPASRNLEIIGKSFFFWISGFPPQAGRYY